MFPEVFVLWGTAWCGRGKGRDNHIFAKLRFNLGLANMQETATMYSFNFFFLWLKITKMILGIGVVATLSKLRDYSHKINESHLLSTICTALHLRFETLLKVLFISLAILSVYWEEQICCTGNFSFEHFLLFLSFCKIVMFVFGVEVRLAVFCLKQHFETNRDRFKTSNLFFSE